MSVTLRLSLLGLLVSCGSVASTAIDAGSDSELPPPDTGGGQPPSDAGNGDLCPSMSCDDGDACTLDTCMASACVHSSIVVHATKTFDATGAIQTFTPDACVRTVTIEASGGQGGSSSTNAQPGGLGAHVKADFVLARGVVLSVLAGSAGGSATFVGGGGGGSFVWNPASLDTPYLVAGGGGGAGVNSAGQPGLATHDGGNGVTTTAGAGTAGHGGVAPSPVTNWAAGGAGWVTDGESGGGPQVATGNCGLAAGGKTPRNGGIGGKAGSSAGTAGSGGFGGGGGAQGQCNATGGGGGGGFSGGGAGIQNGSQTFTGGGGGGSFNAGTNAVSEDGTHQGAGSVTFTW
jgi:hypothetical protein